MPKGKIDPGELLQRHERSAGQGCGTCREPHGSLLRQLLEHAADTQQRVTNKQIANCLREGSGYNYSDSSLTKHLRECVPDLYGKINLARRGPLA